MSNTLVDRLIKLMLSKVGYLCDGLHDFIWLDGKLTLAKSDGNSQRKWLIIVGREHYFESVKDYPIGHLRDVKNVLRHEPWRFPFEGELTQRVQRSEQQSHRVTSWVIKRDAIRALENGSACLIPETACVGERATSDGLMFERLGESVYVAQTLEGLISCLGQERAFFQRIQPATSPQTGDFLVKEKLSGHDALAAVLFGVFHWFKFAPLRFFSGYKISSINADFFRDTLKVSAGIFTLYFAITTIYLSLAERWLNYAIEARQSEGLVSLDIRNELAEKSDQADNIVRILGSLPPLWVTWDLLIDLKSMGTKFRAVNSRDEKVTLYITSSRASDVLEWLQKDARVSTAEFALPVRNVAGLEQCAIVITLRDTGVELPQADNVDLAIIYGVEKASVKTSLRWDG